MCLAPAKGGYMHAATTAAATAESPSSNACSIAEMVYKVLLFTNTNKNGIHAFSYSAYITKPM